MKDEATKVEPTALSTSAEGERAQAHNRDIADTAAKTAPAKNLMSTEQVAERKVRVFIRKDGVLRKDLRELFAVATGKFDGKGNQNRVYRLTEIEATKVAVELLRSTGRNIEKDVQTGRMKAVPGWDLDVRVPGFEESEQKSAQRPAGEVRQRIADATLERVLRENDDLRSQVAALAAKVDGAADPTKEPDEPEPDPTSLEDMTKKDLVEFAAAQEIRVDGKATKAEIIDAIRNGGNAGTDG